MQNTNQRTIRKQQVIDALNEVFNIEEVLKNHYRSFHEVNRSDSDLLHLCSTYLDKTINVKLLDDAWDDGPIMAFCLTYDDHFDICLLGGMNHCYTKFALCKELFHTIIKNPEFHSLDIGESIEVCITGGALSPAPSAEFIAEIAAMEYLFPYKDRISSKKSNIDYGDIANSRKVPRFLIEQYMTNSRMDNLHGCYIDSSYSKVIESCA